MGSCYLKCYLQHAANGIPTALRNPLALFPFSELLSVNISRTETQIFQNLAHKLSNFRKSFSVSKRRVVETIVLRTSAGRDGRLDLQIGMWEGSVGRL